MDILWDLAFVVAVATLGSEYRAAKLPETTPQMALYEYFTTWLPMWTVWMWHEAYMNRFGSKSSWFSRLIYLWTFIGIVGLNLTMRECQHGVYAFGTAGASVCRDATIFMFITRVALAVAWTRAALGVTQGRKWVTFCAVALSIGCLFWFAAIFVSAVSPTAFTVLWWIGIALDFSPFIPARTQWYKKSYLPRNAHLTEERFSLLFIICLGEWIVAAGAVAINADLHGHTRIERYASALMCILIAFLLKLIHIDGASAAKSKSQTPALEYSRFRSLVWICANFSLVSGVLISAAIGEKISSHLSINPTQTLVMTIGVGVALISSAGVSGLHHERGIKKRKVTKRVKILSQVVAGVCVALLGLIPVPSLAHLLLIVVALTIFAAFLFWARRGEVTDSQVQWENNNAVPLLNDESSSSDEEEMPMK